VPFQAVLLWRSHCKREKHKLAEIEREEAAKRPTPVILHVYTINGAGALGAGFGAYHSGIEAPLSCLPAC